MTQCGWVELGRGGEFLTHLWRKEEQVRGHLVFGWRQHRNLDIPFWDGVWAALKLGVGEFWSGGTII